MVSSKPLTDSRVSDRLEQRLVFGLFFLVPALYAIYTNHAWEDWYITYRASKNLAIGNGLVFQPGERLHTFTSPLGTLLPTLFNLLTANSSDDLVLWLYRLFSSVLLGFSGVLLWQSGRQFLTHRLSLWVLLALVLVDVKLIDNSINGMETALMVFFLSFSIRAVLVPAYRTSWQLALGLAGLMWSRPDGFVHATGFLLATVVLPPAGHTRGQWFTHLFKASALGAILYIPWLIWATLYYGSPIPNTIVAKGLEKVEGDSAWALFGQVREIRSFVATVRNLVRAEFIDVSERFGWILTPTYYHFGGWPEWLKYVSRVVCLIAITGWLFPRITWAVRILSFGAMVSCLYLAHLAYAYPWYMPMGALLCYLALMGIVDQLLTRTVRIPSVGYVLRALVVGLVAVQGWTLLAEAYQMRMQQRYIEDGNRKQIGLWLKQNAAPKQTVFMECLGYIGFFSNMKTLDFPGLASTEVIEARKTIEPKKYPFAFPPLVEKLRPDWLVLRDYEIGIISSKTDVLESEYTVAKVFNVNEQIAPLAAMSGYPYLGWDAKFTVFKRNTQPNSSFTASAR